MLFKWRGQFKCIYVLHVLLIPNKTKNVYEQEHRW